MKNTCGGGCLLLINKLQPKISYIVTSVWTGRASPKISNDLKQCCNTCKHYRKGGVADIVCYC